MIITLRLDFSELNLENSHLVTFEYLSSKYYIPLIWKQTNPFHMAVALPLGVRERLGSHKVNEFPMPFDIVYSITPSRAAVLAFNVREEFITLACSWSLIGPASLE